MLTERDPADHTFGEGAVKMVQGAFFFAFIASKFYEGFFIYLLRE